VACGRLGARGVTLATVPVRPRPSAAAAFPWHADQQDGTYRNPVLFGDYSDPDVLRFGDDYYLTASSFTCTPGLPILRSPDLVNWTIVGHALDNLPDARYQKVQHGAGVWAPALREHDGTFYIFFPLPDEGIYVVSARSPLGPWSEPRLLLEGRGLIDPCPFWDDDGKAYLVHAYAKSRAGIKDRLRVRPMAPDGSRVLGEGEIVFHDPARHPTLEGPKLYKRNGWYYILAPAGGVERGWQVALRAHDIYGPYQDRIVLQQGRTVINGPHQGALVETARGEWWFVHFQDAGVYGRIVHLNPVTWEDDWPLMGAAAPETGIREPVLRHAKPIAAPQAAPFAPQTSDDFDGARLGLQWQWQANHHDGWYALDARRGFLRLFPQPIAADNLASLGSLGSLGSSPHLLLQKLPAQAFVAETVVELAATKGKSRAGLTVMGASYAALVVEEADQAHGPRVTLWADKRLVQTAPVAPGPVGLAVAMEEGGACRFSYQSAGATPKEIDYDFRARPGRWVGAKVGIFAGTPAGDKPSGHADFAHFRFHAPGWSSSGPLLGFQDHGRERSLHNFPALAGQPGR
jgi:beta-xylosidase